MERGRGMREKRRRKGMREMERIRDGKRRRDREDGKGMEREGQRKRDELESLKALGLSQCAVVCVASQDYEARELGERPGSAL